MADFFETGKDASTTDIIRAHVLKHQQLHRGDELAAWQRLSEIPTAHELMTFDPSPLPSVGLDSHRSKEEYLETQYRLSRIEGTELLRRAVASFRENPDMMETSDFSIYTQVHTQGYLFARAGAACRISFSTERSPVKFNWAKCDRLTPGSLVVLSPDNFHDQCYVAVVAARYLTGGLEPDRLIGEDENTPPRIEIFWGSTADAIVDPTVEMVMLEANGGYFEQVRHAMVGLQHAAVTRSKFDKYIIDGFQGLEPAAYTTTYPARTPPGAAQLDDSQLSAFDTMTSRELAIVQGPPGTGKTFTSVVAIHSYLTTFASESGRDWNSAPPIIIAAQTNHALDQLLEKCLEFGPNIVRLGGRSKVPSINERTLHNIQRQSKAAKGPMYGESSRREALVKIKAALSMCFPDGIISAEHLRHEGLISEAQFNSLDDDDWETASTAAMEAEEEDGGSSRSSSNGSFEGLLARWLDGCIESDKSFVYRPPTGQIEVSSSDEMDAQEQERREDDGKEKLMGEYIAATSYWTGKLQGNTSGKLWRTHASRYLTTHSDLYNIKPPQRGMVYRHLCCLLREMIISKFPRLLQEYQAACDQIKISRWKQAIKLFQTEGIEVIGCTTTGLTKYRGLLAGLKPRVLIIEEAAETREANITSALFPSLDQLVLVGDHQQLVPHVDVRELGKEPYNLHVSLFERLVKLGIPYSMLQVQRRMIPAIREVVHTFYPDLKDHEIVKDPTERPHVPGMGGSNLWWFQHQWPESFGSDHSFDNPIEADMVVGFVQYLIQNGIKPSQITILTYYRGQVATITSKLRQNRILAGYNPTQNWSVRTVDGFQGEENEIILLSLVRSPSQPHERAKSGFVEDENRAVVATSRARCGMYVFGNSNNILTGSARSQQTWGKVHDVFVQQKCIGYNLPVTCSKHSLVTKIGQPSDWNQVSGGGCHQPCDQVCQRGHPCRITCHDFGCPKCNQPCGQKLSCGHNCQLLCGDACECPRGCNKPALGCSTTEMGAYVPVRLRGGDNRFVPNRQPRRNNMAKFNGHKPAKLDARRRQPHPEGMPSSQRHEAFGQRPQRSGTQPRLPSSQEHAETEQSPPQPMAGSSGDGHRVLTSEELMESGYDLVLALETRPPLQATVVPPSHIVQQLIFFEDDKPAEQEITRDGDGNAKVSAPPQPAFGGWDTWLDCLEGGQVTETETKKDLEAKSKLSRKQILLDDAAGFY